MASPLDFRMPLAARTTAPLSWTLAGALAAFALALAATFSASAALGVALAITLVVGRPATLLWILAASLFIELLRVEGTTISRVLAPLAPLAVSPW